MNVLLVYPATPETFWSFKHVLRFVSKRAAFPPLGLLTVAALLPADWQVKLVDLNVNRLTNDDLRWADYVMISAMVVHKASVTGIVNRCRRFGTPIIAGGPLFTTGYAAFPNIEHFVLGEAEELMPQVIEDMRRGTVRHTYAASSRPDITRVPSPRWDLIDFDAYSTMLVQITRGCPESCTFCNIPSLYGKSTRIKSSTNIIRELDVLYDAGWRGAVMAVDDNFVGNSDAIRTSLVEEVVPWQEERGYPFQFHTQASQPRPACASARAGSSDDAASGAPSWTIQEAAVCLRLCRVASARTRPAGAPFQAW